MGIFDEMENFLFDRFSVTKRHNVHHVISITNSGSGSQTPHQSTPDQLESTGDSGDQQVPQPQHLPQQQHLQSQIQEQHHESQQQHHPQSTHQHSHSRQEQPRYSQQQQHQNHHQSPQQQHQNHHQSQQQQQHRHLQLQHTSQSQEELRPRSLQPQHRQSPQQQHRYSQHHPQSQRPQSLQQHRQSPQQTRVTQQHQHPPQSQLQRQNRSSVQQQDQQCHQPQQSHQPQLQQKLQQQLITRSNSRHDLSKCSNSQSHSSVPNSPTVPRTSSTHAHVPSSPRPEATTDSPGSRRRSPQVSRSRIPSSSPFRDRMSWHEKSRPPTGYSELHSPQLEQRSFPSPVRSRHRASWVELSNLSGSFDFPPSPHPLRRSASSCSSKPDSPTSAAVYNNVNNSNISRPPSAGPLSSSTAADSPPPPSPSVLYNRPSSAGLTHRSPSCERPATPSSPYDNSRPLPQSPSPVVPKLDSPTTPQKQNARNEHVSLPSTFRSEPQLSSLDRPACMVAGGGELPQFGVTQTQPNGVVVTKFCRPKLVRLRSEPTSPFSSNSGSSSLWFNAVDPQSPQSAIRCRRRRRDELKRSQSLEVTSSGSCQEELWTGINVPNQLVITRPQLSRAALNRRHLSLHLDGSPSCGGDNLSRMSGDSGFGRSYPPPLLFHDTHGDNIEVLNNKTRARRYESFCKGICFSNRPVHINEKVYVKFVETNTSWSGVLRFGFTSIDPVSLQGQDLPRYACPDLTNKPGNWAKALGERYATSNILLHFSVNGAGDVTYGVNGEEKGVFFSSVNTTGKLWAMLDVYGNTVAVEFSHANAVFSDPDTNPNQLDTGHVPRSLDDLSFSLHSLSMDNNTPGTASTPNSAFGYPSQQSAVPSVRVHAGIPLNPMPLHNLQGRNVRISGEDRRVAARLESEYCNSLVFSNRPMNYGETVVIQVLSVDRSYIGGLGFGLTACDPSEVEPSSLPDDSDYLLDRLEYWVVNKDVCSAPEIGDELSFSLSVEGEVRYSRNGQLPVTLMHVDKTLPLWVFFDVYGNIQKIKILGCTMSQIQVRPYGSHSSGAVGGGGSSSMPSQKCRLPGSAQPPSLLSPRSLSEPDGHPNLKEDLPGQSSSLPSTPSGVPDDQDKECQVCYEQLVNCVIYKCGHMCLCYDCAQQIKQEKGQCPICRNPITDIIKVYRS